MSNSERPVISLRGPLRRKAEGGWEWTGIWVFGLMQDEETNESLESESPRIGKKKGRKKATNSGARPFRYNFLSPKTASDVSVPWYHHVDTPETDSVSEENNSTNAALPTPRPSPIEPRRTHYNETITTTDLPKSGKLLATHQSKQSHIPLHLFSGTSEHTSNNTDSNNSTNIRVNKFSKQNNHLQQSLDFHDNTFQQSGNIYSTETRAEAEDSAKLDVSSLHKLANPQLTCSQQKTNSNDITHTLYNGDRRNEENQLSRPLSPSSKTNRSEESSVVTNESISHSPTTSLLPNEFSRNITNSTSFNRLDNAENQLLQGERSQDFRNPNPDKNRLPDSISNNFISNSKKFLNEHGTRESRKRPLPQPSSHENQEDLNTAIQLQVDETSKQVDVVTFANITSFIDASSTHPDLCPSGGSWKGYFENIQIRKDRKSSRISETFFLFFNSTPHENARSFYDISNDQKIAQTLDSELMSSSKLLPHHIHVRGRGSNQFGTFELIGCYDLATSILYCHRAYIILPNSENEADHNGASQPEENYSRHDSELACSQQNSQQKKSYYTRKRTLKWQRYDASETDSDEERRRAKKRKTEQTSVATESSLKLHPSIRPSHSATSAAVKKNRSCSNSISKSTRPNSSASRRSAPSSISNKKFQGITSSMDLPAVSACVPYKWKSSHVFSESKFSEDPTNPISGDFSVAVTSTAGDEGIPLYNAHVLYEGEVAKLGVVREGLGVCCYENGYIYEGWWRRNKEHGKGILLTADRRLVIYEGDWERGRMNGKGTYYYARDAGFEPVTPIESNTEFAGDLSPVLQSSFAPLNPLRIQRGGGVYKGDFKENLRHGFGVYYLSDGSIYDGEWRDNLQSGRGMFRWKDGSYYDGHWKDGKRHGHGVLNVANGFCYEGQWIADTMDGRGCCIYPDGQRYEGMWSKGKKEGRGTIGFPNGSIYEGRFKDDEIEGQGTMKITSNVYVPNSDTDNLNKTCSDSNEDNAKNPVDWLMPLQFQSDMGRIHQRAGFSKHGD